MFFWKPFRGKKKRLSPESKSSAPKILYKGYSFRSLEMVAKKFYKNILDICREKPEFASFYEEKKRKDFLLVNISKEGIPDSKSASHWWTNQNLGIPGKVCNRS